MLHGLRMVEFMDVFGRWESIAPSQLGAELLGAGGYSGGGARGIGRAARLDCWMRVWAMRRVAGCLRPRRRSRRCIVGGMRVHGQALPQAPGAPAWVPVGLHGDQGVPARPWFAGLGAVSRGAPSQASAASVAGHDAAPSRSDRSGRRSAKLTGDASQHKWVAGLPACDLVVMLDDAAGAILSAIPVVEEGTAWSFAGFPAVFTSHGLPGQRGH